MRAEDIAVEIDPVELKDSSFHSGDNVWKATTLIDAAKDLPVFDLPLIGIDISVNPWTTNNIMDYAQHMKRVMMCELKYPVILDEYGYICDGWHRVVKALLSGHKTIKAQRLTMMPVPDRIEKSE